MGEKGNRYAMPMLTCTVFVGAFLLFTMEPLAGRILSPTFGGGAHVWLINLTFFQLLLLLGYSYANLVAKKMGGLHLLLLLLPFVNLPFGPPVAPTSKDPILPLLAALLSQFALPFFLLASTAVVAQTWLVRSRPCRDPYSLYGVSNMGALWALIAYPFFIEPFWGLKWQGILWTGSYVLYVMLTVLSYHLISPQLSGPGPMQEIIPADSRKDKPSWAAYLYWMLLSALTSALLLTVTHVMINDVGSFPMVWFLPLAAYLASFAITFRSGHRTARLLNRLWPEIILAGVFLYWVPASHDFLLLGHLVFLFAACLLAHGMLYERRPPAGHRHLSAFYLSIAGGGFIGSVAVSLVAPMAFSQLWEYPLLLLVFSVLFYRRYRRPILFFGRRAFWPVQAVRLMSTALLIGIMIFSTIQPAIGTLRAVHRNFYGISRVTEGCVTESGHVKIRTLIHGSTTHGVQILGSGKEDIPTLYYHSGSGLADAFAAMPAAARIAAIGLGVGTIGAYTRPGDFLHVYEINPDTEKLAWRWFTFLGNAKAHIDVAIDDGRLALQQSAKQENPYDMIFLDAFSGAGIPTHLLTEEAVVLYLSRLHKDGILLFHITSRSYDLHPVIKAAAARLGLLGARNTRTVWREEDSRPIDANYAALTRSKGKLQHLLNQGWTAYNPTDGIKKCRPWTDDYINTLVPLAAKRGLDIF